MFYLNFFLTTTKPVVTILGKRNINCKIQRSSTTQCAIGGAKYADKMPNFQKSFLPRLPHGWEKTKYKDMIFVKSFN